MYKIPFRTTEQCYQTGCPYTIPKLLKAAARERKFMSNSLRSNDINYITLHCRNVCSYHGICTKVKIVHGQTVTKRYWCTKFQACETTWGPWGPCNEYHGSGYRRRVGKCIGTRCEKWVKQVEECDPNPTPSPTTAPPPPPTTTEPGNNTKLQEYDIGKHARAIYITPTFIY